MVTNSNFLQHKGTRIIRSKELTLLTGLSRTTVWRLVNSGDFPAPVSLGVSSIGWNSDQIDAWIQSRPKVRYSPLNNS